MRRAILFSLAVMLAALAPAGAQTTLPFSIKVQQGTNVQFIGDGGTLAMPADAVGRPVDGDITIQYTGTVVTSSVSINQIQLSGSMDFALSGAPDLSMGPLGLAPGSPAFGLHVRYTPTNSKGASGTVTVSYANEKGVPGAFSVKLTGTAPEFAYSYQVLPNGNTTLLAPGATVQLPATAFTDTSSVSITLTNRGTGTGAINNIALNGSSRFVLAGVPFLPATVDPGKSLQFSVRFTPDDFPAVTGDVQVDFVGSSLAFKVSGAGLGPWYEYALVSEKGVATPIDANSTIRLPNAILGGDKTTVTVRVTNTGNDSGRITTLSVSGAAFSLIETPILPLTLLPDGSFIFRIQFAPTQLGKTAGSVRIGSDNFTVEGTGLGPNLTYSYSAAGVTAPVASGGTVVLPAAAVGKTSSVVFTIKNDGTAPQLVNNINASSAGTVFTTSGQPASQSLAAGESLSFTVTFAPAATGNATGTLTVNTVAGTASTVQTFTLSGVGNAPAALPSYSFSGTSGAVGAKQQPTIGLSLASAYDLALAGTLTLTFTSDVFADDPAVMFSSGSRTVAFTIPAGSKQAVFANGALQMGLQSGTVAGTITVTPSFKTATSAIDLTPTTPPAQVLTVAQSAPVLTSVVVSGKANNTITLLVTGYATGRNITQMDFTFTPVSGETLGTAKVSIPVDSTFSAWYQSAASAAYGSQFTATIPFTLAGDIKDTKTISALADTMQSVSVTLTNRQGVSSAVSTNLK